MVWNYIYWFIFDVKLEVSKMILIWLYLDRDEIIDVFNGWF